MEERALLAIVLSIIIFVIFQKYFIPKPVIKKEEESAIKIVDEEEFSYDKEKINEEKFKEFFDDQKNREKREIIIDREKYIAKISNEGGKIVSWQLKEYKKEKKYETWPLKMDFWKKILESYKEIFSKKIINKEEENFVDLAPELLDKNIETIELKWNDEKYGFKKFGQGIYNINEMDEIDSNTNEGIKIIRMSFTDQSGISITKEIKFYEKGYKIGMNIIMKNEYAGKDMEIDYGLFWGPGIGQMKNDAGHHRFIGPVLWIDGKKIRIKPKKIKENIIKEGDTEWIAFEKTYFAAAIISKQKTSRAIILKEEEDGEKWIYVGINYPKRVLKPNEEVRDYYELYIGPKRRENIENIAPNFSEIIDYGWFSFLAKPLIWFLKLSYKYIPNYGIAIIILTIIIKIIFWPLTEKSFGSMRDMQKIQPKMNVLREKFKNDPTKLNKEIMDLYKKHGVNPLGGCLPMILQIPVFFALYEGLLVAIEMRGAPFMLWIKDLSVMDPLLITPIIMGITMYIQQKMVPTGMDPKQAKMMNMMPILFTVFFLGFPSGLVIYWLLNNVLTIGHQYLIQKRSEKLS